MRRLIHLNLFIQSRGHHEAAWRHPKSSKLALTDIDYTVEMTKKAEAGLFEFNLSRRRARPLERRADHALQLVGADHHARCAVDGY